jgi:ribosome-interacting GTPase 1
MHVYVKTTASGTFAGQRVGRAQVLEDEDVVELYER